MSSNDTKQLAGDLHQQVAIHRIALTEAISRCQASSDAVAQAAAAMESATSTGGNTASVAKTLALQLHEFGLKATDAGKAMDVLHLSAALGNSTLEDFANNTSKATAMAANMHVPLVQVDAALSALTRHMDLAQANTSLAGLLSKIVAPSKGAVKELAALSKTTGIDLVGDFSSAGLKAKGLTGVLADLQAATHGNTTELLKVIPAMRGGLAAMVLTGTGAKDFKTDLTQLNDAMSGKLHPTMDAFKRSQQTLNFDLGQLGNIVNVLAIDFGKTLLPAVISVAKGLVPVATAIAVFADSHKGLTEALAKGVAGIAGFFAGLGTMKLALNAAKLAVGPLLTVIGTISAPLVLAAAAVATFALAWKNDWGGLRDKTDKVWKDVQPILSALSKTVSDVASAFQKGGMGAAISALGKDLGNIGPLLKPLGKDMLAAIGAVPAALKTMFDKLGNLKDKVDWGKLLGDGVTQLGHLKDALAAVVSPAIHKGWSDFVSGLQQLGSIKDTVDFGKMFGAVGNATAPLKTQLTKWGQEFSNWIGPAATEFLKNWPFLLNKVLDTIGKAAGPILGKLATWAAQFVAWIVPHLPDIVKKLALINGAITLFITETAGTIALKIVVWAASMTAWVVKHGVPELQKVFPKFMKGLGDLITQGAKDLGTDMAKWAPKLAAWATDGLNQLKPIVQSITTKVMNWLGDTSKVLSDAGLKLLGGLLSGIADKTLDLKKDVQGITTSVLHWIGDTSKVLWNAGADIINGLIGGIESKMKDLGNTLGGVGGFIKSHKGPPEVDRMMLVPAGQLIMQGLLDGIGSKTGDLHTTLAGITSTIRGMGMAGSPSAGGLTPAAAGVAGAGGMPLQLQIVMDGKTLTTAVLDNMRQGQYYRVGLV